MPYRNRDPNSSDLTTRLYGEYYQDPPVREVEVAPEVIAEIVISAYWLSLYSPMLAFMFVPFRMVNCD